MRAEIKTQRITNKVRKSLSYILCKMEKIQGHETISSGSPISEKQEFQKEKEQIHKIQELRNKIFLN